MEWGFNLVDVANGILILFASILGALGLRKGLNSPANKPVEVSAEVAGALVDSTSVRHLTAAVKEYTAEVNNTRQAIYRLNTNVKEVGDEMRELRSTLQRLGDILLSRK